MEDHRRLGAHGRTGRDERGFNPQKVRLSPGIGRTGPPHTEPRANYVTLVFLSTKKLNRGSSLE